MSTPIDPQRNLTKEALEESQERQRIREELWSRFARPGSTPAPPPVSSDPPFEEPVDAPDHYDQEWHVQAEDQIADESSDDDSCVPTGPSKPTNTEPLSTNIQELCQFIQTHHALLIQEAIHAFTTKESEEVQQELPWFELTLLVDIWLLLDFNPQLAMSWIAEGTEAEVYREDWAVACYQLIIDSAEDLVLLPEQMRLTIRLNGYFSLADMVLSDYRQGLNVLSGNVAYNSVTEELMLVPWPCHQQLYLMHGQVLKVEEVTHEIACQRFYCNNTICTNPSFATVSHFKPKGWKVIQRNDDGEPLDTVIVSDLESIELMCAQCELLMEECLSERLYTKNQMLIMKSTKPFSRHHEFRALLTGDLVTTVQIGDFVDMVGQLVHVHSKPRSFHLQVNNLFKTTHMGCRDHLITFPEKMSSLTNERLSWKWTLTLLKSFATDIVPETKWQQLKLLLLLSLVSSAALTETNQNDITSNALHVLVTFAKDELMSTKPILLRLIRYAAGLKPNAAHRHSIDLSLSAALAANGILLIEELEKIKKKQLKDVVTLLHGNGNRASLWTTHSDLSHCIRDPTLQLRGIMNMGLSAETRGLFDGCDGMVRLTRDSCGNGNTYADIQTEECSLDKQLGEHMLNYESGQTTKPEFSTGDFREFIHVCSQQSVMLSSKPNELLTKYFNKCRQMCTDQVNEKFNQQSQCTLVKLMIAHAKLCCRRYTIDDDAFVAVLYFQELLCVKFGTDVFEAESMKWDLMDALHSHFQFEIQKHRWILWLNE